MLGLLVSNADAINVFSLIAFLLLIGLAVRIIQIHRVVKNLKTIQSNIETEAQVIAELIITESKKIMGTLSDLQKAVSDNQTAVSDGFTALDAAMVELQDDIKALPQSADVATEVARLQGNTDVIRDATKKLAQQIRDELPTTELPPVEPPVDNA